MSEATDQVCHDLLRPENPAETGVIKMSYHFSLSEIADRWLERNPDAQSRLHCLSITDSDSPTPQGYGENVSFATARADDLTGVGMKVNQIVGELGVNQTDILVCLDSLDAMLMYTDTRTVFRFIRTISNFLSANDAQIHFHIDPSRDQQELTTLKSAVNAIVEVDETGEASIKVR
ncbi:hypothetical protein [Halobacterium sp. R2-5]|uniref:DUF7504 family protein n=1 Tax=Halobacterium sp. R2-5 TaxID=2715751 RepID=UPI00141EAEF1|nr:hypothetical protein [Halobacterium sp. R2-5]NIC00984.1 hypothetical protein [Halobacterium sp. R2-5]